MNCTYCESKFPPWQEKVEVGYVRGTTRPASQLIIEWGGEAEGSTYHRLPATILQFNVSLFIFFTLSLKTIISIQIRDFDFWQ